MNPLAPGAQGLLRSLALVVFAALSLLAPWRAGAVPVRLQAVECSAATATGFPLAAAVDRLSLPDNGWELAEGFFQEQFAVFALDQPLSASFCQLQFSFLAPAAGAHFGDFEVDVTTDAAPAVGGRWAPLIPETAVANCPDGVRTFGVTTRIERTCPVSVVTLRARLPFTGVTGLRLKLFAATPDPAGQRGASVGCRSDGGFRLTELRFEADPQRTSNLALGRQVYCSRAVAAGLPSRHLTDGFFSTFTHPQAQGGPGAFFELDLGQLTALDHLVIRGREDGTEGDRLGACRVELLSEAGGFAGRTLWETRLHADGSRLAAGGADVLREHDGLGTFSARLIRLRSESALTHQPELAELEVYPALRPVAQDWLADGRLLAGGGEVLLPAGTRRLQFTLTCAGSPLAAFAGAYRWRIPGLRDEWQEAGPDGRVSVTPAPLRGNWQLQFQAQHSDGLWDESSVPVALRVALPWWRDPRIVAALVLGAGLLAAVAWWRVSVRRMKRRLALAQQTLELHRERLRISRDMHDEIGARLTCLALLADRARRQHTPAGGGEDLFARLAEGARATVEALDTIVWAVNPKHDTVGSLADYLAEYAPAYLHTGALACRLDLQVTRPNRPLPLTARHALLMAAKEALQNVLRHAEARGVVVSLRETETGLELGITDDGRGYAAAAVGVTHSGLENMRQRLAEAGGTCEVGPAPDGRGTAVQLRLPLPPPA